jgi:hypothetical protein
MRESRQWEGSGIVGRLSSKALIMKNMTHPNALRYLRAQALLIPRLEYISTIILQCNLSQRKGILSLSRCMKLPSVDEVAQRTSKISMQLGSILDTTIQLNSTEVTLISTLQPCVHLFSSQIYSGLINMLVRNLPLKDTAEYALEIDSGIRKEIFAATGIYHPEVFNWDMLFNYSDPQFRCWGRFHRLYPHSHSLCRQISFRFLSIRTRFPEELFVPALGRKTMGVIASRSYRSLIHHVQDAEVSIDTASPLDAEICQ